MLALLKTRLYSLPWRPSRPFLHQLPPPCFPSQSEKMINQRERQVDKQKDRQTNRKLKKVSVDGNRLTAQPQEITLPAQCPRTMKITFLSVNQNTFQL